MDNNNKEVLVKANQAIINSDNEGFLAYCSENIIWNFIGGETLRGKEEVRRYMNEHYKEPPKFTVERLVAEDNFVVSMGYIDVKDETGKTILHSYCDVWEVVDGKLNRLDAYVIKV